MTDNPSLKDNGKSGSALSVWQDLLRRVEEHGEQYIDQEGRSCKEIRSFSFTVPDARDAAELVRELQRIIPWIYPTPEELRMIMLGGEGGAHAYSYAPRLFGAHGLNQVDGFLIPLLRKNPQTRRAVLMLYEPEHDSHPESSSVPSLLCIYARLGAKLEFTCTIRSSDVFLGFPANLCQLRALQEYVAEKVGVQPGAMHITCGSLHVFPDHKILIDKVLRGDRRAHNHDQIEESDDLD